MASEALEFIELTAIFEVAGTRDLHLVLWSQTSKSSAGDIRYTVKESGEIKIPFESLGKELSPGRYVLEVLS